MEFLFARLGEIAQQAPAHMPWRSTIMRLCAPEARRQLDLDTQGQNLIESARLMRASRVISHEAYCYVVSWVIESLGESRIADMFAREFSPRFREIEVRCGMSPNWEFRAGLEPEDYVALCAEFEDRCADQIADLLRAHGEPVLAELCVRDKQEYARLKSSGRQQLLGTLAPDVFQHSAALR